MLPVEEVSFKGFIDRATSLEQGELSRHRSGFRVCPSDNKVEKPVLSLIFRHVTQRT